MTKKKTSIRYPILLTLDNDTDEYLKEFLQWKARQESRSVASFVKYLIKKEMGSFIVSQEDENVNFKYIKCRK
jgi:hypothetical protein